MKILDLTVEQINLICAVISGESYVTRKSVIAGIFEILPDVEDREMISIAEKTVYMLENMTEEDFDECNFPGISEI